MSTRRRQRAGLARALALAIAAMSAGPALAQIPPAADQKHRALAGMLQPAEILVDQWGVPHIYADSARGAFFVQGYDVARDRLWQIALWRKRGLGLLSRDSAPADVEQDPAARLLYRGDRAAEWAADHYFAGGYPTRLLDREIAEGRKDLVQRQLSLLVSA